jgi:hypothetical protein
MDKIPKQTLKQLYRDRERVCDEWPAELALQAAMSPNFIANFEVCGVFFAGNLLARPESCDFSMFCLSWGLGFKLAS